MSTGPAPDLETLYVVGAGGHGREMAWLAEQIWGRSVRLRFLVTSESYRSGPVNGLPVDVLEAGGTLPEGSGFFAAIGEPRARRDVVERMRQTGALPVTLVHPATGLARTVTLGAGSALCAGSVVTTNITLGAHVHVNVGASISHDVEIGDFTSISPGARVCGHVRIGSEVNIGAGATIINGRPDAPLVIGDGAVIAAGACVVRPVAAGALAIGVPARSTGPAN